MTSEPPNPLAIASGSQEGSTEKDKAVPDSDIQEGPSEDHLESATDLPQSEQLPTSPTNPEQKEPQSTDKHVYRVEYIDNTGTVIAVKRGATPPANDWDQRDDTPAFELIKRIKVFAKTTTDKEKASQEGKSNLRGNDDGPKAEKKDGGSEKLKEAKSSLTHKSKSEGPAAVQDKISDKEDEKLKGFEISPESSTTWSLKILSQYLINALRSIVEYYPAMQLLSHTVEFEEPYKELIHHLTELEFYKDNQPEQHPENYRSVCKRHIEELLAYLGERFGERLQEEFARHKRDPPTCTFPYAWLLFKPGEEIYWRWSKTHTTISSFIVEKVTGGVSGEKRATPLAIKAWNIGYDTEMIGRASYSWNNDILPFDGEKPIQDLALYPAKYYREKGEAGAAVSREDQLVKNGKEFFQFCKPNGHYKMFHGRPWARTIEKPVIRGRVVVDMDQYYADNPDEVTRLMANTNGSESTDSDTELRDTTAGTGCHCIYCSKIPRQRKGRDWTKYDNIIPEECSEPMDDDLFYRLCHARVPAYVLQDRKWELVFISDLHDVSFDENMLESLVLPREIKATVQALAWNASQKTRDTFRSDFIEGKGNGQVLLLHGAPGVGKTATAECVAELVKRPLIALTCGDLGTDVTTVETKLQKYMSWGEIWNAVVLLDEADVYLESRQKGEVKRNALVSVFLRELEQFQGIMFLTTNRVGTFDDAFLSRIHVGLLYPSLNDGDREKIWLNSFERLQREKREPAMSVHSDAEEYVTGGWKKNGEIQKDLLDIKWNGREIRNAFQTALALASYEANGNKKNGQSKKRVQLRAEHIQTVVGMSRQFKKFVSDTKKEGDEESRARLNRLRGSDTGNLKQESSFN